MSWLERTKRTELAIFELIKSVDALLSPTGFGHDIITVTPEQSLDCELGVFELILLTLYSLVSLALAMTEIFFGHDKIKMCFKKHFQYAEFLTSIRPILHQTAH